jgi:serine/threonine protein kinase
MVDTYHIDSKYRYALIDKLNTGELKIDQNMCRCVYTKTSRTISRLNLDDAAQSLTCSYKTVLDALGKTIKMLGAGSYGMATKVCNDAECKLGYAIKVSIQDPNRLFGSYSNPNRPENIEHTMIELLNRRVLLTNMSPHITLHIAHFRCSGAPVIWRNLDDMTSVSNVYEKKVQWDNYIKFINDHQTHGLAWTNVLISELCKFGDLQNYINRNTLSEEDLIVMYFQIIYTFAQIQKEVPGFRHNDAHAGNFLVQEDANWDPLVRKSYVYKFNEQIFKVPVKPFQVKFWDFDFANVCPVDGNELIRTDNLKAQSMFGDNITAESIGFVNVKNDFYDLTMISKKFKDIANQKRYRNLIKFTNFALPDALYNNHTLWDAYNRFIDGRTEYTTAAAVLSRFKKVSIARLHDTDVVDEFGDFSEDDRKNAREKRRENILLEEEEHAREEEEKKTKLEEESKRELERKRHLESKRPPQTEAERKRQPETKERDEKHGAHDLECPSRLHNPMTTPCKPKRTGAYLFHPDKNPDCKEDAGRKFALWNTKCEKPAQAEAERKRQEEAERKRQAQAQTERKRQTEAERKRQTEAERKRQTEAERKERENKRPPMFMGLSQAEAERQRQTERQRQAEAERKRQEDAESERRQAQAERKRQEAEHLEEYARFKKRMEMQKKITEAEQKERENKRFPMDTSMTPVRAPMDTSMTPVHRHRQN